MSFQTLFEIQQSMTVNTRRNVGQQTTRSGQLRTAQYLTTVPWVFTITPHNFLYYPQARSIIQTIDNLDRLTAERIIFNSSNLSWFTKYQGDIVSPSFTLASAPAANATTISVNVSTGAGFAFRAGDFIMIGGYTYKVTADVTRATSPRSVTIHRPIIGLPGAGVTVFSGNDCSFDVVAEQCPTYTLTPMTNGAFVNWDGPFVFRENVTP